MKERNKQMIFKLGLKCVNCENEELQDTDMAIAILPDEDKNMFEFAGKNCAMIHTFVCPNCHSVLVLYNGDYDSHESDINYFVDKYVPQYSISYIRNITTDAETPQEKVIMLVRFILDEAGKEYKPRPEGESPLLGIKRTAVVMDIEIMDPNNIYKKLSNQTEERFELMLDDIDISKETRMKRQVIKNAKK